MAKDALREEYEFRYEKYLTLLAISIEAHLNEHLDSVSRIDRIQARAKSPESFIEKSEQPLKGDDGSKYSDPVNQIQDQIGARIVTYYLNDIPVIATKIEDYYAPIESRTIVPDSPSEFGYEGKHYILFIPEDLLDSSIDRSHVPNFFELQIKTLFQHAWGEANHDLGYKPGTPLTHKQKRKMAFTAAQAWGADQIFNELHSSISRKNHNG